MSVIDRQQEPKIESTERQTYERPDFTVLALSVVTLGGSPGAGDSGSPNSENPFGDPITGEDEIDPDWGYDY